MKSIGQMIEQLDGMLGTQDLTEWETTFVSDICGRAWRNSTTALSEKQVAVIECIYRKHFGDAER